MRAVAYYRVSTEEQGKSALGLDAQIRSVTGYIARTESTLVDSHTDIASGSDADRPGLNRAIASALANDAVLIVARLDRLSRDGHKVPAMLDDMQVTYISSESPEDTPLIKDIKMAVAREERQKLRERTVAALDTIKENIKRDGYHISKAGNKITKLGNADVLDRAKGNRNSVISKQRAARNNPINIRAKAVVPLLLEKGMSTRAVADWMNENGFTTVSGKPIGSTQVQRWAGRRDIKKREQWNQRRKQKR